MNAAKAPEFHFRIMRYEDIPEVCAIEAEAFTSPWSEQAFINELTQNQFAMYIVLEHEGRIVGYGGMWVIIDEAHVTNIAIADEYRGRKLGARLLAELAARAYRMGATRITLEVRVSNAVARNLYGKFGFEAVGLRPGYYSDNGEDAIIMWADLPLRPSAGASSPASAETLPGGD